MFSLEGSLILRMPRKLIHIIDARMEQLRLTTEFSTLLMPLAITITLPFRFGIEISLLVMT